FDNYRAVAPAWTFTDSGWVAPPAQQLFPRPSIGPGASIFHSNAVICVPFNRLAFAQHGGPHGDWGTPANWIEAGNGYVHAETVGDMLQVIWRDFTPTSGRMG